MFCHPVAMAPRVVQCVPTGWCKSCGRKAWILGVPEMCMAANCVPFLMWVEGLLRVNGSGPGFCRSGNGFVDVVSALQPIRIRLRLTTGEAIRSASTGTTDPLGASGSGRTGTIISCPSVARMRRTIRVCVLWLHLQVGVLNHEHQLLVRS